VALTIRPTAPARTHAITRCFNVLCRLMNRCIRNEASQGAYKTPGHSSVKHCRDWQLNLSHEQQTESLNAYRLVEVRLLQFNSNAVVVCHGKHGSVRVHVTDSAEKKFWSTPLCVVFYACRTRCAVLLRVCRKSAGVLLIFRIRLQFSSQF
jgi:hypothetical protein